VNLKDKFVDILSHSCLNISYAEARLEGCGASIGSKNELKDFASSSRR